MNPFGGLDLPLVWAGIIAFAVLAYVILDGFDLGCGILFLAERTDAARGVIVASIVPVWDGNETWLVLGGGGLLAVFPLAYAIILPALYPAVIGMLLSLVFRGVAFEFRFRAATRPGRRLWDAAFCIGSGCAAFCQGVTLGGLVQGIKVSGRAYAGGPWDWLTPFSLTCGAALVVGYALLGATWLIWRTDGDLRARCRVHATRLGVATLAFVVVVSLWTPFLSPTYAARWFGWPGLAMTSPVPVLVALLALRFRTALRGDGDLSPFVCSLGVFTLCFAGLGISLFPMAVPPSLTVWQVAAPPESQAFLLVGAAVLLPMVLAYTCCSYWVFRGKVVGEHVH